MDLGLVVMCVRCMRCGSYQQDQEAAIPEAPQSVAPATFWSVLYLCMVRAHPSRWCSNLRRRQLSTTTQTLTMSLEQADVVE